MCRQGRTRLQTRSTLKEVSPAILHGGIYEITRLCQRSNHGRSYTLHCFAPPQSFLKRFAMRWWQLKCRFAASSAPKLHIFHPPTRFAMAFTIACMHCFTGINLILSRPNCPVLNPWAKLDVQTALVLLGAWQRPRIRRRVRCARRSYTHAH